MAEYINKETLYAELDSKLDGRPMEDTVPWLLCMSIVRKFPAADVVERKRGKWMHTDAFPHHVYCSVCHKTYIPNSEWSIWENRELPRDFCPNCGADMRGET